MATSGSSVAGSSSSRAIPAAGSSASTCSSLASPGADCLSQQPLITTRRRPSICHGSPMRAAMELRGLREMTAFDSTSFAQASFPILQSYEQIVGCIMESLRAACVSLDDFDRGLEAVRSHLLSSSSSVAKRSPMLVPSSPTDLCCSTPSQTCISQPGLRGRSFSSASSKLAGPLTLDVDNTSNGPSSTDCYVSDPLVTRGERKWSMETVSTVFPSSCTNERRPSTMYAQVPPPIITGSVTSTASGMLPPRPPSPQNLLQPTLSFTGNNCVFKGPSPSSSALSEAADHPSASFNKASLLTMKDISLGDVIGCGAMGVVHKGRVKATGQLVAVKIVAVDKHDRSSVAHAEALDNELCLLQYLENARIVRYLGHERVRGSALAAQWGSHFNGTVSDDSERLLVLCEYMPGGSIASAIRQFGAFDEQAIGAHTRQILEGLNFLHNNRVSHRDLKGDNILLDLNGQCKLADFGCSKKLEITAAGSTVIMKTMKGSIPWMAPEVLMGQGYGRPADVWALGLVVVEMASGHNNPWGHFDNIMQAMFRITMCNESPNIPEHLSPNCKDFILKCTAREAKARPTASELLNHPFVLQSSIVVRSG